MAIRAVVFDAYGTLYDVQSVQPHIERLYPGKGDLITSVWRLKQLEYAWLRSLSHEYEDFWNVTRASLDFALRASGVNPDEAARDSMMESYLHLIPYPEAMNALEKLKDRELAILSNGSPGMLEALIRNTGLDRWIKTAISVDPVRAYKPHPLCYALVESTLCVSKQEVLFVSSNGFDVTGAKGFGFNVAWIRRCGSEKAINSVTDPNAMFRILRGREEELGYAPDYIVPALTYLPNVLRYALDRRVAAG